MRRKVIDYLYKNQLLTALFILTTAWILLQLKDVLVALFISYILVAALAPIADFLEKKSIPKTIAVLIAYLTALLGIALILLSLLPFLITQITTLFQQFPSYINNEINIFGINIDSSKINPIITSELESIGRSSLSITSRFFGGVFSTIAIIAISFYLLLGREKIKKSFASLFPQKSQAKALQIIEQSEDKLGSWLRGQIILSFAVGAITWLILTILGIEFALPLAVLAGLLEIIPTIGPIIAAIPAVIVALNISVPLAAVVTGSYILIQLTENNVLVPRIMQKAVGLNPIVIIIGIIVGGKTLGIIGALLSIPFISLIFLIAKSFDWDKNDSPQTTDKS
ncbi:MAG: hypothetical protein COU27_01675 [Candidatus Levybacteria bacterium CG10_big_fil_rev_8_21_14_0_10_36_7]|nr:MAG: hypothetical protein COU27_01675 [Candidatus Levybacteria bacterium CG10_big_fil_rev_8_21_14_0_10_36_7]